jgi:hypothetical protein
MEIKFFEEVLAVKCVSLSGLYLVLAKANKIVFFLAYYFCVKPIQFTKPKNHEKISFILSILLCSTAAFAQEKSDSFGGIRYFLLLRDLSVIGITYERIVSEYVSLEVGVGLPSIGGTKYFSAKSKSKK